MPRVLLTGLVLAAMLASVAGCGLRTSSFGGGWLGGSAGGASVEASNESTSAVPVSSTSRVSITGSKPVDAYVVLGGRIKSCWFNADAPLLRDYVYRADVSPDGDKVQITIHTAAGIGTPRGLDLCHRFQAGRLGYGGEHREPQDAARDCRQDAIRHRPLETRRVELQPGDAQDGCRPCRGAVL